MNLRRIRTFFLRECKDFIWNGQIAVLGLTSLIMIGALYMFDQLGFTLDNHTIKLFNGIPTTLSFIGVLAVMYTQGNLLVEEKEQQTLKLLRLQKVTYSELFIAKALVTYSFSLTLFLLAMLLHGYSFVTLIVSVFFTIPIFLLFIFIGAIIAEYASNTIEVSLYGWPVIFGYFAIEGLINYSADSNLLFLLPNKHMEHGLILIEQQQWLDVLPYSVVPLLWAVLAFFLLKKKRQSTKKASNQRFL